MSLNAAIRKDAQNIWWLDFDADPLAVVYDIILSTGKHVQAGPKAARPGPGVKLGATKPNPLPQIASAHPGPYETAVDPTAPPPPSGFEMFKGACAYASTGVNGLQGAQEKAGITRVRCDFGIATSDSMYSEARRLGMKILCIADYSQGFGSKDESHYPPDNFQAWSDKIANRVEQGKDVIEAVQPWNEPFNSFWMPKPDPSEFLRLVKTLATAVWKLMPTMPIVVCLDYWQGGTGSGQWAKALLAADTGKFLTDPRIRFSAHCYCQDAPPEKDRGAGWSFDRWKLAYAAALAHGHPNPMMWVTEYGWDTPGGSETYPVSEQLQADYTTRGIKMMQASGIVERSFVYQWKADNWYGVMRPDGSARPVCAAVKAL